MTLFLEFWGVLKQGKKHRGHVAQNCYVLFDGYYDLHIFCIFVTTHPVQSHDLYHKTSWEPTIEYPGKFNLSSLYVEVKTLNTTKML